MTQNDRPLTAQQFAELEKEEEDLREIVALVDKEAGLTTDFTDDTDGGRKKKSVKSA